MPLYEYRCAECGENFEQLRRMRDADNGVVCPRCQSEDVERLLSSFATASCSAPSGSRFS
jgi:putative FmdB family regulatory protein